MTRRIHVIGDPMLDTERRVTRQRPNPEEPDTLVYQVAPDVHHEPGGAARAASYLARLLATREGPGEVLLVGLAGLDEDAELLVELLLDADVTPRLTPALADGFRTTHKGRLAHPDGSLALRMDVETPSLAQPQDRVVLEAILDGLDGRRDGLLLSDYGKGTLDAALMAAAIRDVGPDAPVVLDPCPVTPDVRGVTLLTPNEREAEALASELSGGGDPGQKLADWMDTAVAVTRGDREVLVYFPRGKGPEAVLTYTWPEGVSAVGAGDAFAAGCMASLASSWEDVGPDEDLARGAILGAVEAGVAAAARLVGHVDVGWVE